MKLDDFVSYLASTDQLDDFLGIKEEEKEKCLNCNNELAQINENILCCENCGCVYEHNTKDEEKKLVYKARQIGY